MDHLPTLPYVLIYINGILYISFQINIFYVRSFTETCKQSESSCKWQHMYRYITRFIKNIYLFTNFEFEFSYIFRLSPLCMIEEKWKESKEIKLLLRSIVKQCDGEKYSIGWKIFMQICPLQDLFQMQTTYH